MILNGIEDFVTRPDLLERSLLIQHPTSNEEERRTEKALWAEFDVLAPDILGAVFDYLAGGLKELANIVLPRLPRMADFAIFAVACEIARIGNGDEFLRAYQDNQAGANEQVLDDSPVAAALLRFMAEHNEWRGTSTELLKQLADLVPEADRKDREWPKKPNGLSNKLKRLAPSLRRAVQIDVQVGVRDTDRSRTRHTVIRRLPDNPPGGSSKPSTPSTSPAAPDGPADNSTSADRPPSVRTSSAEDTSVQPVTRIPGGAGGADELSGGSSGRPPDPPATSTGKRRRARA